MAKSVTSGYKYFLGVQLALCHGAVDRVLRLIVGERVAWEGDASTDGEVNVDAPDLFGGTKSQGGVAGVMKISMGEVGQTQDPYLVEHCAPNVPAYLGLTTVLFRKFYWSAMNPYFKAPWLEVTRILKGWRGGNAWYPETAPIGNLAVNVTPPNWGDSGGTITLMSQIGGGVFTNYGITERLSALRTPPITSGVWLCYFKLVGEWNSGRENRLFVQIDGAEVWSRVVAGSGGRFKVQINHPITHEYISIGFVGTFTGDINFHVQGLGYGGVTFHSIEPNKRVIESDELNLGILTTDSGDYKYASSFRDLTGEVVTWGSPDWRPAVKASAVDMNPAHIIYQCLTDVDWGMGYSTSDIDDVSFRAAALKLYNEKFGLSLIWEKQMPIMDFVQIICDHINGALQLDLRTGKFKLKLIRDGYDTASLIELNPDNTLSLDSFQRLGLGELVNMMNVVYTDRNQVKQTVTVHDLATLEAQGAIVSTTREYLGIRTPELAMRVASRDLNTVSSPLAKVSLTVNRVLFDKEKGDEVAFTWPKLGINRLPMRIIDIDKGELLNGQMRVELIEDVFGLPAETYVKPQPPIWVDTQEQPKASTLRKVIEVPYWELQRTMSSGDFAVFQNDAAILGTMASDAGSMAYDYGIRTAPTYAEGQRAAFAPTAILLEAIKPAEQSIKISSASLLNEVAIGEYAFIGDEIVRIDLINQSTNTITVGRGCLDTVTTAHAANTPIFFPQDSMGTDGVQHLQGQSVSVKMLPRTGLGELALAEAPTDSVVMVGRFAKPYAPGKLRISGSVETTPSNVYPESIIGDLTVSWATRNRLVQNLEDESVGNITSEPNVTYNLRIYDGVTLLVNEVGLTVTTYTFSTLAVGGGKMLKLELESLRNGVLSFTKHVHEFKLSSGAYLLTEVNEKLLTEDGDNLLWQE